MSDDLISRQAAIDALNKLCGRVCQYSKAQRKVMCGACPLGDAFTVIEDDLPSVQPEQQWIPCSERLPDKREMVIIWIDMPKQPFIQRSIHMAFAWLEPDPRTGELRWMDRHFTKIDDCKVIAWRELPESYQAERRENGSD